MLVEGAIANQEHLEMIHQVRDRTKILISFGDCAVTGNVTALRHPLTQGADSPAARTQSVLDRAYLETATHPQLPESDLVPVLLSQVVPVHKAVPVDVYLPGCPPDASRIQAVLEPLLSGGSPQLPDAEYIRFA